jgi:hypothetical protein
VGGRLTRPLRQLWDLVAIVRCDLTRPIAAATARVPLEGRPVAYNMDPIRAGGGRRRLRDLRPDEVHCLDAYTIPELRGRNIHAALLREMLLFNIGLGYRCGYS